MCLSVISFVLSLYFFQDKGCFLEFSPFNIFWCLSVFNTGSKFSFKFLFFSKVFFNLFILSFDLLEYNFNLSLNEIFVMDMMKQN